MGHWCNGSIRDSNPFDVGSIPTWPDMKIRKSNER